MRLLNVLTPALLLASLLVVLGIGSSRVAAMERMLEEGNDQQRCNAAWRFYRLTSEERPSLEMAPAWVAWKLKGRHFEQSLVRALSDEEPLVRELTANVVGRLFRREARSALQPLLSDPDPNVRRAAQLALGEVVTSDVRIAHTYISN
ncbi:MAG: HEAT repeat domain-containing protein [Candidatus Poribacteria bacterium]|nr:HEAT repeat domain-containing protein [Candidatus Poribacteria bacterium]